MKTETKVEATPGPWKIVKMKFQGDLKDTLFICPTGNFEFNIAQTINGIGVDVEANARLIAAAPELLEALLACEVTLKAFLPDAFATISLVESAINKAKGL